MEPGRNKVKSEDYNQTLFGSEIPAETSPKQYKFQPCDIQLIKKFVENKHYSRSADVAAMYSFAMVSERVGIVAAAIFSKPAMNSIFKLYGGTEDEILELRRLVGVDDTPKNTESYFIGKCLKWLIKNTDKKTIVSYADPSFGHGGGIYKATNFIYDGVSGDTVVLELPLSECKHGPMGGQCAVEGKTHCQVHDRNMRCKTKDGEDYTPAAKRLRMLHEQGIAKLVDREPKHRYHYHLEEKRTEQPQDCRMCVELAKKQLKLVVVSDLKEASDAYIPKGYILGEK